MLVATSTLVYRDIVAHFIEVEVGLAQVSFIVRCPQSYLISSYVIFWLILCYVILSHLILTISAFDFRIALTFNYLIVCSLKFSSFDYSVYFDFRSQVYSLIFLPGFEKRGAASVGSEAMKFGISRVIW